MWTELFRLAIYALLVLRLLLLCAGETSLDMVI
nr:MAG TPA: hypothetical protein [Caudoviricetes sp.]